MTGDGENAFIEAAEAARDRKRIDELIGSIVRVRESFNPQTLGELEPLQMQVLLVLRNKGVQTATTCAQVLKVQRPNVSRAMNDLAKAGLVEKADHPDDVRKKIASITFSGTKRTDYYLARLARVGDARNTLAPPS